MITLTPQNTTPYGHTLSRYNGGDYQGYTVSTNIDGKVYTYDFMDSYELAIQYRDALDAAWKDWSDAASIAENAIINIEQRWADAANMRRGYELLVTHAKYPRWAGCTRYRPLTLAERRAKPQKEIAAKKSSALSKLYGN